MTYSKTCTCGASINRETTEKKVDLEVTCFKCKKPITLKCMNASDKDIK